MIHNDCVGNGRGKLILFPIKLLPGRFASSDRTVFPAYCYQEYFVEVASQGRCKPWGSFLGGGYRSNPPRRQVWLHSARQVCATVYFGDQTMLRKIPGT
jgi:hypothetical protein